MSSPCDWFDWGASFTSSFFKSKTFPSNPLREADNSHVTLVRIECKLCIAKPQVRDFFGGRRGCRWCCHGNHSMALSPGIMYFMASVPTRVVGYQQQMISVCFELLLDFGFSTAESKICLLSIFLLIVWMPRTGLMFHPVCIPTSQPVFPRSALGPSQPWPLTEDEWMNNRLECFFIYMVFT